MFSIYELGITNVSLLCGLSEGIYIGIIESEEV